MGRKIKAVKPRKLPTKQPSSEAIRLQKNKKPANNNINNKLKPANNISNKPKPAKAKNSKKKSQDKTDDIENMSSEMSDTAAAAGVTNLVLPTVETDSTLQLLAEKTAAAEREAEAAAADQAPQKVKVKRKDALVKNGTNQTDKTSPEEEFIEVPTENPEDQASDKSVKKNSMQKGDGVRKTKKKRKTKNYAAIYLSHIPHGFYEKQMHDFFEQFGTVTNLRLGRSTKSGRSKGYAFVEFKYLEVAKIVAETMNNYLMFNKILKCEVIPKEKMSRAMFLGKVNPLRPQGLVARQKAKKLHNSKKTAKTNSNSKSRTKRKLNSFHSKLQGLGIEYNIEVA